jgi:hypothetical protein
VLQNFDTNPKTAMSKSLPPILVCLVAGVAKQRLYKGVAHGLSQRLSLGREDVFMNLVEVTEESWSFGNGEVQYAT